MEDKHKKPSLSQKIQQLSSIELPEIKKLVLFTQFGWRWVWNQFPAYQKAIEDTHHKQKHLLQLYFWDRAATPSLRFISVLIISNQCSWMKIVFVIMIRVSMTSLGKYFSELHKEVLSMPVASQVKTQDCGTYWEGKVGIAVQDLGSWRDSSDQVHMCELITLDFLCGRWMQIKIINLHMVLWVNWITNLYLHDCGQHRMTDLNYASVLGIKICDIENFSIWADIRSAQ